LAGVIGQVGAHLGGAIRALAAVARRPGLWPVALREAKRLAAPGWWRRPPFLPLPPSDYRRFRLETMYGRGDHPPEPADLVRWLEWCRAH
jgi:hypothetical protein